MRTEQIGRGAAACSRDVPIAVQTGARVSDPSYDKYVKTQISKLDDPVHHSNIVHDDKNKIEPELYTRFSKYQRDGIIDFVGKRAICVGARLGAEVRAMRRIGALAVGVDLNPGLNNPHVLLGDAHSIGFAPGSADLLYSNVLDHILDIDGFIEQVADQLAGGALFLMDLSKKAPDKYATNDFRKKKGDVMESLRNNFAVVHELDESKPEQVWFIVARRKVRLDGKSSGSVPAVLVVGDPIANVRSSALALKAEGVFVIAMSPGASKDKTVLTCSQDLQSGKGQLRTEQIGRGAAACSLDFPIATRTGADHQLTHKIVNDRLGQNKKDALMVVAHPDDEIIWGEIALQDANFAWTVLIVTTESAHRSNLAKTASKIGGYELIVWDYADCSQCVPFKLGTRETYVDSDDSSIHSSLKDLVQSKDWKRIVTHGEIGEYGHPQHKELNFLLRNVTNSGKLYVFSPTWDKISSVRSSYLWKIYSEDRPNLDSYYGNYKSNIVPIIQYDGAAMMTQCRMRFPWDCAFFSCQDISFEGKRVCGIKNQHGPSYGPEPGSKDCFCPDSIILQNLQPEFDMGQWFVQGMTWKRYRDIYMSSKLKENDKGRALIKWNDKIWLYKYFKSQDIPMIPVVYTSNTSPSVKGIIQSMRNYAVKPSHTSSSMFMWIVKDGKMATVPQSSKWGKVGNGAVPKKGTVVDLEKVEVSMRAAWKTHTHHEDWPRNNVPPGVIVERLVPDNTEIKYTVVWGKVVGFLVDGNSVDYFIRNGVQPNGHSVRFLWDGTPEHGPMNPKGIPPPHWWKEGAELAQKVARLARCDHVRADFYYYNGAAVLNEFTWNPGGEAQDTSGLAAKVLNLGYKMRRDKSPCPCNTQYAINKK